MLSVDDYIELAISIARRSPNRIKHAALVIDSKGRILSYGNNIQYVHAEVAALRKLSPTQRKGKKLISIRLTQSGKRIAIAKPCKACQKALRKYGIREVYFSTRERTIERMLIPT